MYSHNLITDSLRDNLLTDFGKATLLDRYVLEGESPQDVFARVASYYSNDGKHAQRLYDYISKHWFMPSTPILSNGGTKRGLPISCFLNETKDSLKGILSLWNENVWLASGGGGIGSYWGNLRSLGEKVGTRGETCGIIPFIKVMDSQTLAVSQGCVDGETEVLTQSGWVKFEHLDESHGKVAQVDSDFNMSFVDVTNYVKYKYNGKLEYYTNEGNTCNMLLTPNHRVAYEKLRKVENVRHWVSKLNIKESSEFHPNRDNRIYTTGKTCVNEFETILSPLEQFKIAYQADGSTKPKGNSTGELSGTLMYAFRFRKQRKIDRLLAILEQCGFGYSINKHINGTTSILVKVPVGIKLSKTFSDWVCLYSINTTWAKSFIEEIKHWDGSTNGLSTIRYDTTHTTNADLVTAVACLAGYKAFNQVKERAWPRKKLYKSNICIDRNTIGGENIIKTYKDFNGLVYCISVPSGMFIARRNGCTFVTGNSLRRGSAAVYLPINHPEIEEFIDVRRPTGGDSNRRSLNLHHGVTVDDKFMEAVEKNSEYALLSPKDQAVIRTINARTLWVKLITTRLETGEPYILFSDIVNRLAPDSYKEAGLKVRTSNLCSEIVLTTGEDDLGKARTAVCCLSSLNLDYYDEWKDNKQFYKDVLYFLDNVLEDFIKSAPSEMQKAVYAAIMERSIGLGVMGFHSYLQSKMLPFDCAMAKSTNMQIFSKINKYCQDINEELANERGQNPDCKRTGINKRFTHVTAIAPTASISIIAGTTSPSIDPFTANIYTHKTLSGSFTVYNQHLKKLLEGYGKDTKEVWSNITRHEGSIQQLEFLSPEEKDIFKTALELNPYWIIEHAADRTPFIDQAQSVNLWLPANVDKKDLHLIHYLAWKRGLKSLYYLRSTSVQSADKISKQIAYEECIACQ